MSGTTASPMRWTTRSCVVDEGQDEGSDTTTSSADSNPILRSSTDQTENYGTPINRTRAGGHSWHLNPSTSGRARPRENRQDRPGQGRSIPEYVKRRRERRKELLASQSCCEWEGSSSSKTTGPTEKRKNSSGEKTQPSRAGKKQT